MTHSSSNNLATVVISYGRQLLIETDDGALLPAIAMGRRLQAVCGDRVEWQQEADGTNVIQDIAPRSTQLIRHDSRKGHRLLAANVDCLLVVLATEPEADLSLLDCYLIAAECLGIEASLIFNKSDLLDNPSRKHWEDRLQPYIDIGYSLIWTTAKTGTQNDNHAELHALLRNRCGVLVGQSGVGKSSLINALIPDHAPRTQSLSAAISAGRHTTTATRLYHLPDRAGRIIDSPGVRDFRLWDISRDELMRGYREFHDHLGQCRFNDCLHISEPDCAIRSAVESGRVSQQRYASYSRLLHQLGLNH